MTKRATEAEFGRALREVDLLTHVYRPPDPKSGEGVSNWKPADFLVWIATRRIVGRVELEKPDPMSIWFEVKDVDAVHSFPFSEIRPSQLQGIHDATRLGIPYWLAVWWRRHKLWTISDAAKVLAWRADRTIKPEHVQESVDVYRQFGPDVKLDESWLNPPATSVAFVALESRFGISATKAQLGSTLKQVLLGEAD